MAKSVHLFERNAPVIAAADVVVVGGGSAGIAAAVSAAQEGARTILVERYGFFGGNAVSAWVGTICGLYRKSPDGFDRVCRGFAGMWADEIGALGLGGGPIPFKETAVFLYVPWAYKKLADRVVTAEQNLTPLLHCTVTEVVRPGTSIDAVVVGSKQGPLALKGAVYIDATGDADVVHHAGARTEMGGPGQRQFPSMQFLMQNVDVATAYSAGLDHLNDLLRTKGREIGLSRTGGAVLPTPRKGEVYGAMTRIGVEGHSPDMTDPFEATKAEIEGRAEAERAGRFLIENMPGFEEAYFADTPTQLGVRETRRAVGDYVMTGDDVLGAARFYDAIACGAWPQEFHVAGTETEYVWLDEGAYYQVPYRSLLVRGVDNLLVAGRCISATHEALASTRVIAPSMAQGEAAGVAAAQIVATGSSARELDVEKLQRTLRARGAFLGDDA